MTTFFWLLTKKRKNAPIKLRLNAVEKSIYSNTNNIFFKSDGLILTCKNL